MEVVKLRAPAPRTQNGAKRRRMLGFQMVERTGIEPVTPTMSTWCSPAELTLPCHLHQQGCR